MLTMLKKLVNTFIIVSVRTFDLRLPRLSATLGSGDNGGLIVSSWRCVFGWRPWCGAG